MSYEEKVRWLCQYRDAMLMIRTMEEDLQQLREEARRITTAMGGSGSGHTSSDRIPRQVGRILQAEEELSDCIADLERRRERVIAVIGQEKRWSSYAVLYRRYILGQRFERIAESIRYDPRHVRRLHKKAVENLVIPEN